MMNHFAVIVAAGSGSRMKKSIPKQFIEVSGKPVLFHSIQTFLTALPGVKIIIVFSKQYLSFGKDLLNGLFPDNDFWFAEGGETRFHSVKNGLALIPGDSDGLVMVHDAARCLITSDLIQRLLSTADATGAAIPVVDCADSIRWVEDGGHKPLERSRVKLVQTPQAFKCRLLLSAFKADYSDAFTDEATVVEASGHSVTLVPGDTQNIKVTRDLDLIMAHAILSERKSSA